MTSFEKVVKLACKPKAAPPKAKYLDPIIAATWSEDGAVHDVCKALSPRFREPNAIVVFKALIVLHTMIRNGATDNVLQYLSSSEVLRLKNVSAGTWEGYNAPENLQNYSKYLDTRIRAYRDLKHDAIRVQSETNRDMRNSQAIDEEMEATGRKRSKPAPPQVSSGIQRSKTMAGRKLRIMTVEKGLLRETKIVQKMIDALVECRFYLDDLEDELNITALRMLVKDLLILFQACNEGVINVLEHYFEMSHIDAEAALAIYRHFCKETERVVEYLGVAKKLQNLLNVPIPNLRHAPVSLAGSLEEYLKDPNFEQNRIEYKTNKELADKNAKSGVKGIVKPPEKAPTAKPAEPPAAAASSSQPAAPAKSPGNQSMMDFFSAIEEEQQSMFNPQTNSPSTNYFQQQATFNPFAQQMTGAQFGAQAFAQPQIQAQPTGFLLPQQTAFQIPQQPVNTNPFGAQLSQQQHQQQQQQPSFQSFLQPQHTAMLQPQMTGANPFRQSTLFPQMTGMPSFGTGMSVSQSTNPFPVQNPVQMQATGMGHQPGAAPNQTSVNFFTSMTGMPNTTSPSTMTPTVVSPFAQPAASTAASASVPPRSATAPLTNPMSATSSFGPPPAQPVKTHQTGSRNPFGVPVTPVPPVPKPPTLMELAMGVGGSQTNTAAGNLQQQPQNGVPSTNFGLNGFGSTSGSQSGSSAMSSIASSFSFNSDAKPNGSQPSSFTSPLTAQPTSSTATASTFSDSVFSSLSTPSAGTASTTSSSFSPAATTLQRQPTGFSGIKAFKPSSSFGAALLESLPPIPQSSPTTPQPSSMGTSSLTSQPTGFGALNAQSTGAFGASSLGSLHVPHVDRDAYGSVRHGSWGSAPFMSSMSTPALTNATNGLGTQSSPFGVRSNPTGHVDPAATAAAERDGFIDLDRFCCAMDSLGQVAFWLKFFVLLFSSPIYDTYLCSLLEDDTLIIVFLSKA
ncbi:ENTH domain-containing protein C19F8.03c [Grifola frondosa]|uniref:ENTH domain-containing protein C19F8.03c n=1 Tax=Grifola frondosa TaxID=5627 RepID=A0A1C7LPJ3_GRIFR|nr:ENTH domain-containing protein C19F8.03c [Grifola frondosa]